MSRNKKRRSNQGEEFSFIDLFSGCGGLSLGLGKAGWKGRFAVEKHPDAFETLRRNLVDNPVHGHYQWPRWVSKEAHDITRFLRRYKSELINLQGKVKLVAGGPPCQGFSFAGKRRADDQRNTMVNQYVKFIERVRPEYLILENVEGIKHRFAKHAEGADPGVSHAEQLKSDLQKLGYQVYERVLQSSDFFVPQRRRRYVLLGVRQDKLWQVSNKFEEQFNPFNYLELVKSMFLFKYGLKPEDITPRRALSDLENRCGLIECIDTKGFQQIKYSGAKTNLQRALRRDVDDPLQPPNSLRRARHSDVVRTRFEKIIAHARAQNRLGVSLSQEEREKLGIRKQSLVVLDPERVTHTVTTLPDDILHYKEPRILTVRENARLQTFPDWFEFTGKYTTGGERRKVDCPRYTQVGNAVPPFLGEILGQLVMHVDRELAKQTRRNSSGRVRSWKKAVA